MSVNLVFALLVTVAVAVTAGGGSQQGGILIRNGRVIDGTGAAARVADVRLSGDSVVEVGGSLPRRSGERVIDAGGRAVAPGFIDLHSHADGGIEEAPDAASQVRQGVTTALVGQDGGGELPISGLAERLQRARPAINFATSVGHGTVRRLVMGDDFRRAATAAEIETMKALVERGMRDGAFGLSSGLEYDPGFYAETTELIALASVVKPHGGIYSSHVRDEENEFAAAWKEAIEIGRRAGVPVHISHMKLASKPVWGRAGDGLALLEAAAREGVRVTGDWYPYPYWQSAIYVLIPDRDFENVAKWRLGLEEIGGAGNVLVTGYRADPTWNGRTLAELAARQRVDPAELIVRMVREAGPGIGIIGTSMDEADMTAILSHPLVRICSDGQLAGRHPRGYGTFPRVLGRYVRERQALSLEAAIAKMTGGSAAVLGLTDRGLLQAGMKADVVVFDPATVADRGTPAEPALAPVGIDTVIVNGEVVLDSGGLTAARPGRVLRKGRRH